MRAWEPDSYNNFMKKNINLWKIEEDVKKALLFNEIYFGQQNNVENFFKRGAIELSVWIEHDVKKLTFQHNIFWSTQVEHFLKKVL